MEQLLSNIRKKYPFVEIEVYESSYKIEIMKIQIPKEKRNLGIGSDIIKTIQDYAKSVHKPIVLSPESEKGHKQDLERFYKNLGFLYNKGRNIDYTLSSPTSKTMYWRFKEHNINFKHWLLLNEGLIQIPYKVIKPIVDDYFNFFKNVNLGKTKIKDEAKTYKIDLSGTNYDFPNIIPKLNVTYKGLRGKNIGSYHTSETKIEYPPLPYSPQEDPITVIGKITLKKDLSDNSPVELIEHEVMHFIQDLININMSHNKQIYKNDGKLGSGKRPEFGGSGPRKLTQNLMRSYNANFYGYNKNQNRMIDHEKRATEFQTNLSSILIMLNKQFINKFLSGNLNPNYFSYDYDIVKDIKTKEDFEKNKDVIVKFINNQNVKNKYIRDGISTGLLSYSTYKLYKVKKFDEELYNWYLGEIYKNFVAKDIEEDKLNQIVDEYFFNKNKLSDEDIYLANNINFRNFIVFYKDILGYTYTIRHHIHLAKMLRQSEDIENVSAIYLYDFTKRIIDKFYQIEGLGWMDSDYAKEVEEEEEEKYLEQYEGTSVTKKTMNRYKLKTIFWFIKNLKRKIDTKENSTSLDEISEKIARFLAEDIAWSYEQHYEKKKINKKPPTANDILKDFWTT